MIRLQITPKNKYPYYAKVLYSTSGIRRGTIVIVGGPVWSKSSEVWVVCALRKTHDNWYPIVPRERIRKLNKKVKIRIPDAGKTYIPGGGFMEDEE